jgi:hypothetical protein
MAGVYRYSKRDTDTLFVKDGKLYSASDGMALKLNFPINDSEYMEKNGLGKWYLTKTLKVKWIPTPIKRKMVKKSR